VIGQDQPCREGPGEWVGSGPFRPKKFELNPIADLSLLPFDPQLKPVKFLFVRDEMTRTLMLLHGEIDVLQNSLTLAKTRWIQTEHSDQFSVLERLGVNVAYLAFNQKNPFLRDINVRRAIAHAIPREDVVHYKMFGFGSIAGSFLSPSLPESLQLPFLYDPKLSEGLLDQAGYKRGPNGVRFRLRYRTTSLREGHEQVLIYSKSLEKIGIKIDVEMTEPAVFLASVRKGNFDLYSSRWVGVGDGSILYSTLFSTQPNNRAGYKNQKMDELLNSAMSEVDTQKRIKTLQIVQKMMLDEMTYFPLYYWANSVILKRELAPRVDPQKLSLSGALEPLIYQLQQ
jgi:ABC-type transport system substrate-binding protein